LIRLSDKRKETIDNLASHCYKHTAMICGCKPTCEICQVSI
jgi:hypothetical protein